jgi:hypothetical protein
MHLELLKATSHALHGLVKGWGTGDDLGQQGIVVAADDVTGSDSAVQPNSRSPRGAVGFQSATVRLQAATYDHHTDWHVPMNQLQLAVVLF